MLKETSSNLFVKFAYNEKWQRGKQNESCVCQMGMTNPIPIDGRLDVANHHGMAVDPLNTFWRQSTLLPQSLYNDCASSYYQQSLLPTIIPTVPSNDTIKGIIGYIHFDCSKLNHIFAIYRNIPVLMRNTGLLMARVPVVTTHRSRMYQDQKSVITPSCVHRPNQLKNRIQPQLFLYVISCS